MKIQAIIQRTKEAHARLWAPPNARFSSELEILSGRKLREKQFLDDDTKSRKTAKIERFWRGYCAARQIKKLADMHRYPQAAPDPSNPPLIDGTCKWPISIRDICRATCWHLDVNMLDFVSHRRQARIVRARHIAMYLCRRMTTRSLPEIGRTMGGRDHTTILHGERSIVGKLPHDEKLRADVAAIEAALKRQTNGLV